MPTKVPLPVPQPIYQTVKLTVLKDLRAGNIVYIAGDTIEVFYHEAVKLTTDYPDHFEVVAQ